MNCKCEDPECPEHTEEYRCTNQATGQFIFRAIGEHMDLCPGCKTNLLETTEITRIEWIEFEKESK